MTLNRLKAEGRDLFREANVEFSREGDNGRSFVVREEVAGYKVRKKRKTSKRKT